MLLGLLHKDGLSGKNMQHSRKGGEVYKIVVEKSKGNMVSRILFIRR
jgi:hypothetical protein